MVRQNLYSPSRPWCPPRRTQPQALPQGQGLISFSHRGVPSIASVGCKGLHKHEGDTHLRTVASPAGLAFLCGAVALPMSGLHQELLSPIPANVTRVTFLVGNHHSPIMEMMVGKSHPGGVTKVSHPLGRGSYCPIQRKPR